MTKESTLKETLDKMVVYAMAQSRDDRTMEIFSSLQEGLVTDYTERQHIMQLIEDKAPVSDTEKHNILLRTGKDWMSGFLRPDFSGPNGRRRPVQFIVQGFSWKLVEPNVLAKSVVGATELLLGQEVSEQRKKLILGKITSAAMHKKRLGGCLVLVCTIIVIFLLAACILLF